MAIGDINARQVIWANAGLEYLYFPDGLPKPEKKVQSRPPKPEKKAESAQKPPAPEAKAFTPIAIQDMPQAWGTILERAARGKVAWTYLELGSDLAGGKPNQEADEKKGMRRQTLMRLIQDLKLPAGTHTFWPLTLDGPDSFSSQVFWSGLNHLGCRGLIVCGSGAGEILMPDKALKPFTYHNIYGKFVWIVRDLNMIAATPQYYAGVLAFLKNCLSRFA